MENEETKLKFVRTRPYTYECRIKKEGILLGWMMLTNLEVSAWEIKIYPDGERNSFRFRMKKFRGSQANAEAAAVAFFRKSIEIEYSRLKSILEALENHEESTN
jgi:hypothetical protein